MNLDDTIRTLAISQAWQLAFCAAFAAGLTWMVGFRRPHLAYALWMLVLLKALTPPVVASPASPFSWLQWQTNSAARSVVQTPETAPRVVIPDLPSEPVSRTSEQPASSPMLASSPAKGITAWLSFGWLSGSVLVLSWIVVGQVVWWRKLRCSSLPIAPQLQQLTDDLVLRLGMRKSPRLIVSSLDVGPLAGGIVRPTVVLPAALQDRPREELEPLLAHELVHLRRRDPAWAVVQWAAMMVWWWNPVVWWASRAVSRERERCCDAEVIGSLSYPPENYAQGLLEVLRTQTGRRHVPVPLTLPLRDVTRRRFDYILQAAPFASRPPRRHLLIALALALLLLPGGRFAAEAISQEREVQTTGQRPSGSSELEEIHVKTPELVYLTWQEKSREWSAPHTLWRPDGSLVDKKEAAEALKEAESFLIHRPRQGELHPLVFVFRVDDKLESTNVFPTAYRDDGHSTRSGGSVASDGRALAASVLAPRKDNWKQWPGHVSLDIKYSIDDVQIIKTITEIPDEVVQVAEGVTWYIDPVQTFEYDPVTKHTRRVFGKATTVPVKPVAALQYAARALHRYDSHVYLRDTDKRLNGWLNRSIEQDGQPFQLVTTKPFDSKTDIARVEFTRQRHARARIENVKLRLDLLPTVAGEQTSERANDVLDPSSDQTESADASDPNDVEAIKSFDRDYGLKTGEVIKRIPPPFPASRMAFYRIRNEKQAAALPEGPSSMVFRWDNGQAKLNRMMFDDATRGVMLRELLPVLCQIGPDRLRGDEGLLDQRLPGDFSIDASASREAIIRELNRILQQAKPRPVSVNLEQAEEHVYVARGPFKMSEAAEERGQILIERALVGTANSVEEAIEQARFAPRAHLDGILEWVSKCTEVPIINEVQSPPKGRIRFNSILLSNFRSGSPFDPQPVIDGVSQQTGLKFTKEKRSVLTLTIKEVR